MGMMETALVVTWDSLAIAHLFPEDEQYEGAWGSIGEPLALQALRQRGAPGLGQDPPLPPPPLPLQAATGWGPPACGTAQLPVKW